MEFQIETYLDSLPNDIVEICISSKNITDLSRFDFSRFSELVVFDCSKNELTSLPTSLPRSLKQLWCASNKLTYLPDFTEYPNLELIDCSCNQFTYLPTLPPNIKVVYFEHNQLTSLPDFTKYPVLEEFDCSKNHLTSLPTSLPQSLIKFDCSKNHLTSLPDLTGNLNLEVFHFSNNQITDLPTLPQRIKNLSCCNNQLTSLPNFTGFSNLEVLDCSKNQIRRLPTFIPKLVILGCYGNQLTYLPTLPLSIREVFCYDNQLAFLPTLPHHLKDFVNFNHFNNPICEIVGSSYFTLIKQNIQILNNSRHLWRCLQYETKLRVWLWKARERIAMKKYHPDHLMRLGDDDDLDDFLKEWEK